MSAAAQIDYNALAKQAGAVQSQPAPQAPAGNVDYAALAKQSGATDSQAPPLAQPEKPGYLKRLGQALGIPTSMDEMQAASEASNKEAGAMAVAGPAVPLAKMVYGYGKTALRGLLEGNEEAAQAIENASKGGPFLDNLGKTVYAGAHMGLSQVPFIGPSIETAGQDIAQGNYGGAAGGLTGVVGQVVVPELIKRGGAGLAKMASPLGEVLTQNRGVTPAESFTPLEIADYADKYSIPLNAAQATGHNLPLNLQSAAERGTIGGTAVRKQTLASQAAVMDHAENLLSQVSPQTQDLASVGAAIKKSVQEALDAQQETATQNYQDIDAHAGGQSVDLAVVKKVAQSVLEDSQFVRDLGLDPRRASSILQSLTEAPDTGSFSDAQQLRSSLLDASRSPDLAISSQAQGWLKLVTKAVDDSMMESAKNVPGLEKDFRAANTHWQTLQDDFNNPRSPLNQILAEPDPSKVPQKLTVKGQVGGSPYNPGLLDKYGIDKAPVKWAILNDIAGKDFRILSKKLGGYSDDFLRSVFSPEEMDDIYQTGVIARSVGLNTNPSGTAGVSGAMEDIRHPILSAAPKAVAAKLTQSPAFNERLMTPPSPPRNLSTIALSQFLRPPTDSKQQP